MEDLEQENMAANDVEVANPQATEEVENNSAEVQGEQGSAETVKEVTDTQAFSQRLKEMTQREVDKVYADLFKDSEFEIRSKADYDALAERQRIQEEALAKNYDPELYEKVVTMEKELSEFRSQKTMSQQEEVLSKDETYGAFFNEHKDEIKNLANSFDGGIKGNLDVAMTLYIKQEFPKFLKQTAEKAEQAAVEKIIKNQKTSPGSLSAGGDKETNSIWEMSSQDFKAMQEKALRGELKK